MYERIILKLIFKGILQASGHIYIYELIMSMLILNRVGIRFNWLYMGLSGGKWTSCSIQGGEEL
jgi:hypothetical protein